MKRRSLSLKVANIVAKVIIILFSLAPIYACLIVSLTPYSHMLTPQLVPHFLALSNYTEAFGGIVLNMLNSFAYSIATILLVMVTCIPLAYICTRYEFKLKKYLLFGVLLTQMISGIVLLPSLYQNYNMLGLLNNRLVLIFTFAGVNMGMTIWLLIGFFKELPYAVEEAAHIDGANFVTTLVRIVIPISVPGIAVGAVFTFINSYNEFIIPLFLIVTPEFKPLTLRLYSYLSDTTVKWNVVGAAAMIGMVPAIAIFLACQNYIIGGITTGAVKN